MPAITKNDLQIGIEETDAMIATLLEKKYLHGEEKTLSDVIFRLSKIVEHKASAIERVNSPCLLENSNLHSRTHQRFGYSNNDIKGARLIMEEGYFLPGGSILAGMTSDPTKKSSLSNCYVLPIKRDSIEDIFDGMKESARTYSYRGGVGLDITVLRPNDTAVNNAANTSSGAVSFMPMISQVNATIGTKGRRAAMLISMDVRHPDIMEFIWSKADPEAVFVRDHMSHDVTARTIQKLIKEGNLSKDIEDLLIPLVTKGKLPEVNTANISVKFTHEFMQLVESKDPNPWVCLFPNIEIDKDRYNKDWDGVYENWMEKGGSLVSYTEHRANITSTNFKRYIGRIERLNGISIKLSSALLKEKLDNSAGYYQAVLVNPSPYQIFTELAMAVWERGDPGLLFWDTQCKYTLGNYIHRKLQLLTTNPCGEQAIPAFASCLIGAHDYSRYVENPWTEAAIFRLDLFLRNCYFATILMNVFSDLNEDLHPLEAQRKMERFGKRIGIEFTALADMLSMLNMPYDSEQAVIFIEQISGYKAVMELYASAYLAKTIGPCEACDPKLNGVGLENMLRKSPYYKELAACIESFKVHRVWENSTSGLSKVELEEINELIQIDKDFFEYPTGYILKYGLRNTALNTAGPTGSLSVLLGNCSSGIEPVFSLFTKRTTRVGNRKEYHICHTPIAKMLLNSNSNLLATEDMDSIKNKLCVMTADQVTAEAKIAIQRAAQKYCDSSISSTVNLPNDTTVEDIVDVYLKAYRAGLKGLTIYRDGSLDGVLVSMDKSGKKKEKSNRAAEYQSENAVLVQEADDSIREHSQILQNIEVPIFRRGENSCQEHSTAPIDARTTISKDTINSEISNCFARGEVIDLPEVNPSQRHEVYWNGCKLYVVVSTDKQGNPMELFISNLPREVSTNEGIFNELDYQEKMSLWMALTRTISVGLRAGVNVKEYAKQLRKASFVMNDLMSVIVRVLHYYTASPDEKTALLTEISDMDEESRTNDSRTSTCPMCKTKSLVHTGGCDICFNPECMHSTCG